MASLGFLKHGGFSMLRLLIWLLISKRKPKLPVLLKANSHFCHILLVKASHKAAQIQKKGRQITSSWWAEAVVRTEKGGTVGSHIWRLFTTMMVMAGKGRKIWLKRAGSLLFGPGRCLKMTLSCCPQEDQSPGNSPYSSSHSGSCISEPHGHLWLPP